MTAAGPEQRRGQGGGAECATGPGVILLASYNGAAYLPAQLQSFAAQSLQDWRLIVSDDGSEDETLQQLAEAGEAMIRAGRPGITLLQGPRQGLVCNFFHLLAQIPAGSAWAALSDQDDVWFPDKLERACAALSNVDAARPALYLARSMVSDAALRPLHPTPLLRRGPDFRNALVQSIGSGNTMVLNRAAIALVQAALAEARVSVVHDWWLYQIITACGGRVLWDPQPVLFYRQHGGNQIGSDRSALARLRRILLRSGRDFAAWNRVNLSALGRSRHRFTPGAAQVFDAWCLASGGGGFRARLRGLKAAGVWRQSRSGTLMLYLACLAGRL